MLKRGYDTEGEVVRAVFTPCVEQVRESVVRLEADGALVALGMVVSADGQVLTKASELRDDHGNARTVSAVFVDGRRAAVEVLAVDFRDDLALLRVDQAVWPTAAVVWPEGMTEDEGLALGRWVVVPGLDAVPLAVGVVSAVQRSLPPVRLGVAFFVDPTRERLVVSDVKHNMGAAAAGVQKDDVLLELEGAELHTIEDVREPLRNRGAGDTLDLVVEREGERITLEVTLMNRPIDLKNRSDFMNHMGNAISRRRDGFDRVFQHDATISPSQCGGPVVDVDGRLLGVNIARAGRVEAFVLPVEVVAAALKRLRAGAKE
ncbi:MAG: trypsin-like peptidase domain-containing protein [Algisphaera sp.]